MRKEGAIPLKKCFGESAEFVWGDENEKAEAKQYLLLWKKFFIRKLQKDSYRVEVVDEQWVEREPMYIGALAQRGSLSLKICVEGKYFYDLEGI